MGGNAFAALLSPTAFPRMPPAAYSALKARLLPTIKNFYEHVAVPLEAPEKTSYGDVDFIVAGAMINHPSGQVNAPHDIVQKAINAQYGNTIDGNRTSNFAVPIALHEWKALGCEAEEEEARQLSPNGDIYYQVDINVCKDQGEFERIVFFHAYGDLGMIMGLVARNAGLALGEKGLKMPNPPHPPIDLSQSFDDIMNFMGWSMDAWKAGFRTKREVFEWAGSTRFFNLAMFRSHGEGFTKVKAERKMYAEFVQWVEEQTLAIPSPAEGKNKREENRQVFRDAALVYFNKKGLYEALTREREDRAALKQVFSGSQVRDWAELGNYWKGVKLIMDAVRERLGGDEGVLRLYEDEGEEGVKRVVLEEKGRLSIASSEGETSLIRSSSKKAEDELVKGINELALGDM
ncbi:hypothetical protein H0H87_006657 [Tephrocybe sp. NHM501043]|nr:hypothetical protein H0H87_006657 [Tephrocybe sp. NHM501043]